MILAVDIGTTFLKVAVVSYNGEILFTEKRSVKSNIHEVDPKNWIFGLDSLVKSIPVKFIHGLDCVVVSGNGPTFIPVDINGDPVGNAILWSDTRSAIYSQEINELLGESVPPTFFMARAYWFKNVDPKNYSKTVSFLSCPEYICFLLTGEKRTLLPAKGFEPFYWNDEKLQKLSLDIDKFPKYLSPDSAYGKLKEDNPIGLSCKDIPVICSGPDYLMSLLGTGSVQEGVVCDRTGTSEGINFCTKNPKYFKDLRTLPHIVDGLYTIAGLIPDSGEYVLSDELDSLIEAYSSIINRMIEYGLDIKEIRVIGGHAGLDKINKLKSDAFPFPLKIYQDGADLLGNAVLGAVVLGKFRNIEEACRFMIKEKLCYNG